MIKINTLTQEEIDKININEIDLNSRVTNILINKNIRTLSDLANFIEEFSINDLYCVEGFGSKCLKEVVELLNHAYPNLNLGKSIKKYTFK